MDLESPESREIKTIMLEIQQIMKGSFSSFMQKEIFEQPESVVNTMRGRSPDVCYFHCLPWYHDDIFTKLFLKKFIIFEVIDNRYVLVCTGNEFKIKFLALLSFTVYFLITGLISVELLIITLGSMLAMQGGSTLRLALSTWAESRTIFQRSDAADASCSLVRRS